MERRIKTSMIKPIASKTFSGAITSDSFFVPKIIKLLFLKDKFSKSLIWIRDNLSTTHSFLYHAFLIIR